MRESGYTGPKLLNMKLPGRRKRDLREDYMQRAGVAEVPSRHVVNRAAERKEDDGSRQNKTLLSQRRSQSVQMSCMEAASNCPGQQTLTVLSSCYAMCCNDGLVTAGLFP